MKPSEDEDDDETSSSGSSSSDLDPDSDSPPDQVSSNAPAATGGANDDETSPSGSSFSSSNDSEPDQGKQTKTFVRSAYPITPDTSIDEPKIKSIQTLTEPVPPGHGKPGTRKRNARRKARAALNRLKESGELPQDAILEDLRKYRKEEAWSNRQGPDPETRELVALRNSTTNHMQSIGKNDHPLASFSKQERFAKFIEKRQALLDSLHSDGGIDVTAEKEGEESARAEASDKQEAEAEDAQDEHVNEPASQCELPLAGEPDTNEPVATEVSGPAATQPVGGESNPADVQVPDSLPKEPEPTPVKDTRSKLHGAAASCIHAIGRG